MKQLLITAICILMYTSVMAENLSDCASGFSTEPSVHSVFTPVPAKLFCPVFDKSPEARKNRSLFLFTAFLILFVYHINMYLMHAADRSLLFFSLLNASTAVYYLAAFLQLTLSTPNSAFTYVRFLYFFDVVTIFFLFLTFYHALDNSSIKILKVLPVIPLGALAFLPFLAPAPAYFTYSLFKICLLAILLYETRLLFTKKDTSARCALSALLLFSLVSILALPINQIYLSHSMLYPLSQFILYFSIIHLVVQKYLSSFDHEIKLQQQLREKSEALEEINKELSSLNRNLETNVEERTVQYRAALRGVEATLSELEKAHNKIEHDLHVSSNVQKIYFSDNIPRVNDWETAFVYRPMQRVSGDMYDLYVNEGKLTGVSLFDVSGHGVQSALITMLAKNIISEFFYKLYEKPAGYILEIINKRLIEEIGPMDNYLTGLLVKVNGNTLEVANASHANILHRIDKTGTVRQLEPKKGKGNFLGIKLMDEPYPTDYYQIADEDSILLYSDGIYEHDFGSTRISNGHAKLIKTLENCRQYQSARSQLDYILKGFNIGPQTELKDDMTLVLLKKTALV